ncbi:hypothetical protein ACJ41O_014928 [Fusarium nematophilum]
MQAIDIDSMMDNIVPLSQIPWDQLWSTSEPAYPSPSHAMDHAGVYAQDEPQPKLQGFMSGQSGYATGYPAAGFDSIPPTQHCYPDPSPVPASAPACPADSPMSLGTPGGRRSSSSSHPERRRKRQAADRPAKPGRGSSSKSKPEQPAQTTTRTRTRRRSQKQQEETALPSPEEHSDHSNYDDVDDADYHTRRLQERNRIASNKFRVKKREDAKRLQSDEEDMERINRDLNSCVADLTHEVYQLKMRLLQHTDCDCSLIQHYIANEANRYIEDMGTGQRPHQHPQHPHH